MSPLIADPPEKILEGKAIVVFISPLVNMKVFLSFVTLGALIFPMKFVSKRDPFIPTLQQDTNGVTPFGLTTVNLS